MQGYPIIKTYKLLTNSKEIAAEVGWQLTQQQREQCRPLDGKNVTNSQAYPTGMVRALLWGLRREAKMRSVNRFDEDEEAHSVLAAQPVEDEAAWRATLDEVTKIFRTSSVKSINLPHGHEIHQRVAQRVPWKLTRVQIAATPASRRLPRDIIYTHRGCALLYNDGGMTQAPRWSSQSNVLGSQLPLVSSNTARRRRRFIKKRSPIQPCRCPV